MNGRRATENGDIYSCPCEKISSGQIPSSRPSFDVRWLTSDVVNIALLISRKVFLLVDEWTSAANCIRTFHFHFGFILCMWIHFKSEAKRSVIGHRQHIENETRQFVCPYALIMCQAFIKTLIWFRREFMDVCVVFAIYVNVATICDEADSNGNVQSANKSAAAANWIYFNIYAK